MYTAEAASLLQVGCPWRCTPSPHTRMHMRLAIEISLTIAISALSLPQGAAHQLGQQTCSWSQGALSCAQLKMQKSSEKPWT
jgi:hypothetical protein